jgi:16S rRNA (guanine966-N2)-methyltransferase
MRIIAGTARGRRLRAPDTPETRPATDRAREAVFSSLGDFVTDATVVDLYAGSGSYGLEALSRGAASALFVERGRKALAALRRNVDDVALGGEVRAESVESFLGRATGQFDLVFIDPPWDLPSATLGSQLEALDGMVVAGGMVVVSRRAGDELPQPPETWRVATDKRYGDTRILRYEKLKAAL